MASGNGNDPRLETLEQTLRNAQPESMQNIHPREIDHLNNRMELAAAACDELAEYFRSFAQHLRKSQRDFDSNVRQMMGKIAGK